MFVERIVKKDTKNVVVHVSNGDTLILSLDVFLQSGLKKNEEISDDRFSSLIRENKLFYIRQRALNYLGRRPHSLFELRVKLIQKGYEKDLVNEVLEYLTDKNYLNDLVFAKQFYKAKLDTKGWSKKRLKSELIKKGINSGIIDEVLRENYNEVIELENATTAALKKLISFKDKTGDKNILRNKLSSFLNLKGYSYDITKEVCDKLISEENLD
jgi:regulatory protein